MKWKEISTVEGVEEILNLSNENPQLIFKHSTSCSISAIALARLKDAIIDGVEIYLLDLLAHREVSNYIADRLDVYHESPQLILIDKGEVVYEESHLDIHPEGLSEQLQML